MSRSNHGFSIVELLVVITIMVVLLALLAPALDKAIYQAQLAVCATHQHAIARGAMTYAMSSQRHYPYRAGVREGTVWEATTIYNGDPRINVFYAGLGQLNGVGPQTDVNIYDDRPILRTFLSLNGHLNDPLTGTIDMDTADTDSNIDSVYSLWFGWSYPGQQRMSRLGDRWAYRNPNRPADDFLFDVLASDTEIINGAANANPTVQSSHPDSEGRLVNIVLQNEDNGLPDKYTKSFWYGNRTGRGAVDLNYAFQDGSVSRYLVDLPDPAMVRVPHYNYVLGWWATMPPQRR